MNSALLVGGDGLIAQSLRSRLLADGWNVNCTSRRGQMYEGWTHLDLQEGVDTLPSDVIKESKLVFICAAVTGFMACADNPDFSRYVNVTRTVELAKRFMLNGARVVYLSSNAVFDGKLMDAAENAPTCPVTEYGHQKADCEAEMLEAANKTPGNCAVVRLTKVVDRAQPLFKGWMQNIRSNAPLKAAADLVLCPVTTSYVANGLQFIGSGNQSGVYHLSGERDMTYFELACAMASALDAQASVIEDWVKERLGSVPTPTHTSLSMPLTTGIFGLKPQSLVEVIEELILSEN
jgi:dTDP-4-dehydrorhamnose reductase